MMTRRMRPLAVAATALFTLCASACLVDEGHSGRGGGATTSTAIGSGGASSSSSSSTSSSSGTGGTGGTGGAGGCATAADCPGMDTACTTRTCSAGVCGIAFTPAGVPAGPAVSGDCQRVVCDGNGAAVAQPDDTDVPSDGNACTVDACASGSPVHTGAPAGTSCGPGGQLSCDGAGVCVGCTKNTDCGVDTACAVYSCDTISGLCAVTYVPAGQGDPGGQAAGDCWRVACNGSGGVVTIPDDTDLPDDGNPCTLDGCALGVPTHAPVSAGSPCGNGYLCDGAGSCLACLADADCGAVTPCAAPACAGGVCVTTFTPSGTGDPGGQTNGDCRRLACDGNGGTQSLVEDADVPDDGNPCTADACSAGVPTHMLLAAGAPCGPGLECDGQGACVGCLADVECGTNSVCATYHCQAGTCVMESTPAGTGDPGGQVAFDCKKVVCDGFGGIATVPDGTDFQDDGNPCTTEVCVQGTLVTGVLSPGSTCGAGLSCNGTSCVAGCVIGGALIATGTVNPVNPCQVCDPLVSGSSWSPRSASTPCDDGNPCTGPDHCAAGACTGTAHPCAPTSCQTTSVCDGKGGCTVSNLPDGTLCPDAFMGPFPPGPGVCVGGTCQWGCWVDGHYVFPNDPGTNTVFCQWCDPSYSRTSYRYWGCHVGPVTCSCQNGIGYFNTDCAAGCGDCSLQVCNSYGHLCYGMPKNAFGPCADDGNVCTADLCDYFGHCVHSAKIPDDGTSCGPGQICWGGGCAQACFIGGTTYPSGTVNPANACEACDSATSTSAWTARPDGTTCGSGLTCNNGVCM